MLSTEHKAGSRSELSRWPTAAWTRLSVGIVATLLSVSCNQDYSAPLVNGYKLVRANASSITVNGPRRVVGNTETRGRIHSSFYAGPIVDGLDVIDDVIVGHARVETPPLPQIPGQHPGYFVIKTSTGEHWLELTKDEFDVRCKVLGIVPNLKQPSYFKK
jgi:hypothetical protein